MNVFYLGARGMTLSSFPCQFVVSQLAFTFSESMMETLEKGVKYVQSLQ